jgi:hypothetical protein
MAKLNIASVAAVLLAVLMMGTASATWVNYKLIEGVVPSHIYPINLKKGDSFRAEVRWANTDIDLDMYFYKSG